VNELQEVIHGDCRDGFGDGGELIVIGVLESSRWAEVLGW
jgi:hypothetical protein